MKQISILFISWFLAAFSYKAMAQNDAKMETKKTEEIIIRKKGDKDVSLSIQITGDKIIVNGKPLVEFNDENITVHKRVFSKNEFKNMEGFNFEMENFNKDMKKFNFEMENFNWNSGKKGVMLGVSTDEKDGGVIINSVTKSSAAEKAGLQKGDIITKFGSTKISTPSELSGAVNKMKAGDKVKVTFKRNGKEKDENVILEERKEMSFAFNMPNGNNRVYTVPGRPAMPRTPTPPYTTRRAPYINDMQIQREIDGAMDYAYAFGRPKLGMQIQDTEDEKGVQVLSIEENSASAMAGLKKDDVIIQIGDAKIMNTDDAREALSDNHDKSIYKIKARRNGNEMSFDVKIAKKLKKATL
ncbi:MAG: PDZ domain-containing protein [Ferruginibacter sp.]